MTKINEKESGVGSCLKSRYRTFRQLLNEIDFESNFIPSRSLIHLAAQKSSLLTKSLKGKIGAGSFQAF